MQNITIKWVDDTYIYVKYDENLKDYFKDKEYFSFDNSSINTGIDTLKKEYLNVYLVFQSFTVH